MENDQKLQQANQTKANSRLFPLSLEKQRENYNLSLYCN